jgi:hypothetical protein
MGYAFNPQVLHKAQIPMKGAVLPLQLTRLSASMPVRCRGWKVFFCVFAAAVVLGLQAGRAAAQSEQAVDFVQPVITRMQYTALLDRVNASREQRHVFESMFRDYTTGLTELIGATDRAADAAGRQQVLDAYAGKARLKPEELKVLRIKVMNAYAESWPTADSLIDFLLGGTQALLLAEQEAAFDAAVRELRREMLLHPRRNRASFEEYAGDGVDVLVLAAEARADGGELRTLDAGALADVLGTYELQLDAMLIETAGDDRTGEMAIRIAQIRNDTAEIREAYGDAITRWQRLYDLNLRTVGLIGEIAAERLGEGAQRAWLDRFDRACFEWLYRPRTPDLQFEWISEQELADEARNKAGETYRAYRTRRDALNRQSIEIMLRSRRELKTVIYSMMDPTGIASSQVRSLYEDLLRISGERSTLEAHTSGTLESLLSPQKRDTMKNELRRMRRRD